MANLITVNFKYYNVDEIDPMEYEKIIPLDCLPRFNEMVYIQSGLFKVTALIWDHRIIDDKLVVTIFLDEVYKTPDSKKYFK